ncbi:MAG: hypothetical protein OEY70_18550, partial [Acidimicrobiia bacterium]|nr:hypothetical protein [Acidimicrobiia bacterium]
FPPPVCFIHVPKTAGTSMAALLARHYDDRMVSRSRLVFDLGADPDEARYRLWHGHYGVGDIAPFLPPGTRFVTSLRDPVHRVVSLYHYWRNVDLAFYHHTRETDPNYDGVMLAVGCQGLDEFLATDDPSILREISDAQTRYLVGSLLEPGPVSAEQALDRIIEREIVVVRQAHFASDTPDAVEALLGVRPRAAEVPHLNTHSYQVRVTPAQRARILALNGQDLVLCREADRLAASAPARPRKVRSAHGERSRGAAQGRPGGAGRRVAQAARRLVREGLYRRQPVPHPGPQA